MGKYWIITYGCQMNKSDSERIATVLENIGYKLASKESEADLIVVNMCSVRQSAVDRVFGISQKLGNLKFQNPNSKTVLTGCILKEDRKKFAQRFDLILDIKDLLNWPNLLRIKNYELGIKNYLRVIPKYQNNFSAFIPISNGCNNFCSYCVVPFVRGPLICRPHQDILKEVKNAVRKRLNPIRNAIFHPVRQNLSNGAREIWLLGQNVNDYASRNNEVNFAKLLKMINDIPGNFWIRFTSSNPKDFSDELIETMAKCQKVTPYLNLPVQSGDNKILRRMNRQYTVGQYKVLVKKLKTAFKKYRNGLEKELAISTDVIVGFPGEKESHFGNTKKLFKEVGFSMAYIAQCSPRPGTAAYNLKDDVPSFEKQKREKELTKILEKSALKFNRKFLNKIVEVLVNEKKKDFYLGKTRYHQTIKIKSDKNILGNFVKAKVIKIMPYGLEGKLIE